jgi:hypothetical protein
MTAKVRFGDDQPEYRFDFTFDKLTKEPLVPSARPIGTPTTASAANTTTPTLPPPPASSPANPEPALTSPSIPTTMAGIVEQLKARHQQVGELVGRGDFGAVWVPAFQAKDLAIALEPHLAHLAEPRRDVAEPAIAAVVRAAWLLDAAGDVGNRQQIESAYAMFSRAVTNLATAFEGL